MQAISKIEQPNSPSSTSNNNYSPKSSKDLMQTLTIFLEKGQQSALQMRSIINKRLGFKAERNDDTCFDDVDDDHDHDQVFDHHTRVTLSSFETCLSMIKSFDLDHHEMIKKRKLDHHNYAISDLCSDLSSKSEEIIDGGKVPKERRGCYKRRRTGQSKIVVAPSLIDDGFAWRKYGQKEILHTKYPRNYYRCTHKVDQNCQATKQVQQISENPTQYSIVYHGQHTCKNLQKTPSIILDTPSEENSSFYLSFDSKNHSSSKHALTPSLFPSSAFHHNNHHPSPNNTMVKQEHTSIKTETPPLAPLDLDLDHDHEHKHKHKHDHCSGGAHQQDSSSSDDQPPSSSVSDLTSTGLPPTPVSDQSSSAELYSSTASPYDIEFMDDDFFINIMNMGDNQCCSLDTFLDFL